MIRVSRLIEELQKFPQDALAYAYEGEVVGVVVRSRDDAKQIGYIPASEYGTDFDGPAVIKTT